MPGKSYIEYQRFCETFEIKYSENGFFCGDDWKYNDLIAPHNRMYIILDGEGIVDTQERTYQLRKGYAYIVPANMNFSCNSPIYLKKLYVHFNAEKSFFHDIFEDVNTILEQKIDINLFNRCYEILEQEKCSYYYEVKGYFSEQIYNFISILDPKLLNRDYASFSPKLYKVHKVLNEHLSAKLRISDLARLIGVSHSTLSRQYKEETGQTLKCYVQKRLINKAQILLLTTTKNIQEIADELGYDDALYFSRIFSKRVGVSPTLYRRQNKVW